MSSIRIILLGIVIALTSPVFPSKAVEPDSERVALSTENFILIPENFIENGEELTIFSSQKEGFISTKEVLPPGFYEFFGEYRNENFDASGSFVTEVRSADQSSPLSPADTAAVQSEWTPLVVYFKLDQPGRARIRLGVWQKAQKNGTTSLRNIKVIPFDLAKHAGENWLPNPNWSNGKEGYLPPGWFRKSAPDSGDEIVLKENTTFKSGKYILSMTGPGPKQSMLQARYMPLPPGGEIVFSIWARSSNHAKIILNVVSDGWAFRIEKLYEPADFWKQYTAVLPVPPKSNKNWFFLRIDQKEPGATVELAEARVTWKPDGTSSTETKGEIKIDPLEDAYSRGWQGTPGVNLAYNPDFELGGIGYFYDYSWPKEYSQYTNVRLSKPTTLLPGKGVDGGTCALIQGATLRSYCFPVSVGQEYTISADLRAPEGQTSAECTVNANDSEWNNALSVKVTDIPGNEWKHYSWTFNWSKNNIQKRGYVRFDSKSVMIDRLQVAMGKVEEYQAPPVMLGLMTSRGQYFVRGRDEAKATIKIVPGKFQDGATDVEVVALDAWGRETWKKSLTAPLNKITEVPVDLSTEKLGTFHVSLTAKMGGKILGIGIGRYAVIEKAIQQETSLGHPGLAGICQESFNFPVWLCTDHAVIQKDLGIRLNRFFASVPPNLPYPIPAEFTADLLAKCKPFQEASIDLLPCIDVIPEETSKAVANIDMPRPADLESYGKHLAMYVQALSPGIRYWEIFNEPNLWRVNSGPNRGKRTMYAAKYFEFQKVAYATIKGIDPKMQVFCNAINNLQWDWIEEWMKLGGGDYMDAFSFHPYGVTDFTAEGLKLEKTMDGFNFKKPFVNSEKYYGANLFYDRAGYEETRRGYYLPYNKELSIAGWSIEHFVSSAALGVPVCFFNPGGTMFTRGPGNELFVYDFFAAYSAAIRFMVTAGRGNAVEVGSAVKAILFSSAKEGPLLVVWTENPDANARLKLSGEYTAYDIMGNAYTAEQQRDGVRLAADPTYVRYKAGTAESAIRTSLSQADVIGLGAPIATSLSITGPDRLSIAVTNVQPKPISGQVKLLALPQDWRVASPSQPFTDLASGQTVRLDFALESGRIENMAEYPVTYLAEAGDEFVRKDVTLRPLYATRRDDIGKADGDLAKWKNAQWITLGDGQISAKLGNQKRDGDQDLSAKMALVWSPTHLSIVLVATDNVFSPPKSPAEGWTGDSLQLFFNAQPIVVNAPHHDSTDIRYTLSLIDGKAYAWLDKGAEGNFKGVANKTDGFHDDDVDVAIRHDGNSTVYEIVLPRDKCLPGVQLGKDGALGFSLLLNDNDGPGRKTGLTLSPRGTEPFNHSRDYRNITFLDH